MTKEERLLNLLEKNNGYLFTSEVVKEDISKTYMLSFVRERRLEKAAHGIYVSEETWPDELFILQKTSPQVIFFGETSLYLNGLMEREYSLVQVCVPTGYNGAHLRKRNIRVKQASKDIYLLGRTTIETNFGNTVTAYDAEKSICDLIAMRKTMDVQVFQTAIKEYMSRKEKDISRLVSYAEKMKMRDEIMKYVEVLV